ncbi:aldehyde dehydrogenase family protein [Brumicola pallidula]|jgi:aldehyde dehydrogenase (NAD+)|uniref:Aldehyde dehydrogenase n=1 Tax=Brumicola pallidula DSM 14239 = ACAM 615 TaxID=1121922 RepID=K6ZA58_9ALTE|nr:aldehyde dehydrogenase family protein [Glaciecola pallidula]GAC27257.1 aldehyde dehydrogenase [Glaciecola pallidula DSM 14239 = ACAM 615]
MNTQQFYINGAWVDPVSAGTIEVVNPATQNVIYQLANATSSDVDLAVSAAKNAFPHYSLISLNERVELLEDINALLIKRNDEIADAISLEMGAPISLARNAQAPSGSQHFAEMIEVLKKFRSSSTTSNGTFVRKEPIGTCALITPWNWPLNQIATKVAPALAAGCTMVLKPSEIAPLDAIILAEILHEAGVPKGVFNLIHGTGASIGNSLTSHKDIDMVSFTGSTRAGIAISQSAAPSIKRVALELGGKSAGIVYGKVDASKVAQQIVDSSMLNSGQSCNALTRVLVASDQYDEICKEIIQCMQALSVDMPQQSPNLGPVSNAAQYKKVLGFIQSGIDSGATLLTGGADMPSHLEKGFFVKPTLFGDVTPDMTIAREEIFGPVLCLMKYQELSAAIDIANASEYGLSGFVWCDDHDNAVNIADQLRTGMVHLNGAGLDASAPFGGYKMSGNGREWGAFGLEEYLECKSIYGGAKN